MYLTKATKDTKRVVVCRDTGRILHRMKEWYDRCKDEMNRAGIHQEDLMPVFQVTTRGAVGHYLTGRRNPSAMQILAVAKRLGVMVEWLLTGEDPKYPIGNVAEQHAAYQNSDAATRELIDTILKSDRQGRLSPTTADILRQLVATLDGGLAKDRGYERLPKEAARKNYSPTE
ncbi:MAG: hypothetical protein U9P00_11940 [Pseudomonadota bacterium]|nr:hypothetical protein [Pseudomonadota bacterium]